PAPEVPPRIAAALIHADSRLGPQLRQPGDLPGLAFEGESALDADDGSASTARAHCRRDVADMPPLDAVASQGEDVSGEHVDPAQPAPGRRPYGPFAVKGARIGELFCPHGLRQAHLAGSDKASQTAGTPRTSPSGSLTRARVLSFLRPWPSPRSRRCRRAAPRAAARIR